MNAAISERVAVLGGVVGTATSTPLYTEYVDLRIVNFQKLMGIFHTLAVTDAETLICSWVMASDSSGTGVAALLAAATRAAHATANDDITIIIDLNKSKQIVAMETNSKPFVALKALTSSTTGTTIAMIILGADGKHGPVDDFDSAKVVEIVRS